ncbi:MAG TPA: flippase-like domain-containing protein [Verrucomicrobiae bacterium]
MKALWKTLALILGLAFLGWYLSKTDLNAVWTSLKTLGWLAPIALVPYFIVYIFDCYGWRFTFPKELKVPFWTLFRVRWTGEAMNNIVPSAYVGGEALKIYLLKKHGVTGNAATSSAVVSKTAQTVAQVLFITLAAIAFMYVGGDNPGLRAGMMVVLIGGVLVVAGLLWVQRRGIFSTALLITNTLGLKLAVIEKNREKIQAVDGTITTFYREHRPRFYASTTSYLGGWLMDTMEIYLVAHLLGMPITIPQAIAVEAFTSVAKMLGMWVPGSIGVQESGIIMLGKMAGLPETLCIAYALLRRAREVIFVLIGWLLFYTEEASLKALKERAEADPTSTP